MTKSLRAEADSSYSLFPEGGKFSLYGHIVDGYKSMIGKRVQLDLGPLGLASLLGILATWKPGVFRAIAKTLDEMDAQYGPPDKMYDRYDTQRNNGVRSAVLEALLKEANGEAPA